MKIYDSLKSLITAEMISKASATLGESNQKVSSAVSTILPSLLAKLVKVGETPRLKEVAEFAGKKKVLSQLDNVFSGHGIFDSVNVGERFENALLGDENSAFASAVASKAGIQKESADRLTSWVSGVIAAFLGDKMVNENQSLANLIAQVGKEKDEFSAMIPAGIVSSLGLSSVLGAVAKPKAPEKPMAAKASEKKEGSGWIVWLIIILLLLLLLFFWWKSCNKHKVEKYSMNNAIEKVEGDARKLGAAVEKEAKELLNDLENAEHKMEDAIEDAANKVRTELTLADGKKINVYKNGCEECMVAFIKSDEFKKATDAELKNTWFEFDDVDFKFGSSTELMGNSEGQIKNIAAVLKNYPDLKVRIGAYADKVGSDKANMKISEARANHIKSLLEKEGVAAARIVTQGFGEEFAKYPESAPDSLRKNDRDIAMRFIK